MSRWAFLHHPGRESFRLAAGASTVLGFGSRKMTPSGPIHAGKFRPRQGPAVGAASQTFTAGVGDDPADNSREPSALKHTSPYAPFSRSASTPVVMSHKMMVPSPLLVINRCPSGLNRRH